MVFNFLKGQPTTIITKDLKATSPEKGMAWHVTSFLTLSESSKAVLDATFSLFSSLLIGFTPTVAPYTSTVEEIMLEAIY